MRKLSPALRRFTWSPLICFGLAALLMQTAAMQETSWRLLDWQTRWRAHFQRPADPRIAVALFEDGTEDLVSWPPDREYHATLLALLAAGGASVVTWDVILDASREGDGDARLANTAAAVRAAGTGVVVASVSDSGEGAEAVDDAPAPPDATEPLRRVEGEVEAVFGDKAAVRPYPALRAAALYGFADAPRASDGISRKLPLVVRIGSELYPSLSLQTVMSFLRVAPADVRVKLGDAVYISSRNGEYRVPIDEHGRYWINYRYDHDDLKPDFATFTYRELLMKLKAELIDGAPLPGRQPDVAGRIVLVGQTVTGKADAGPTPRSAFAPLVLVHANIIDNILNRDFVRRAPDWAVWLGAILIGYAGLLPVLSRSFRLQIGIALLVLAAAASVTFWGWIAANWWVPLLGPALGFVGLQFVVIGRRVLHEQQAREQLKQMFTSYLSPELLQKMLRRNKLAEISSERRPVTILFSDLRDFTSWSERTKEETLIAQLNEYLAAMVECIHDQGGTLHKFIGDAVMAVWGDLASAGPAEDARRAARAALAMQARLVELNAAWAAAGRQTLRMGVGLNHGMVLVGNIGSPRRMEFTVIGDPVNLAARLENLNKKWNSPILVGESLEPLLGDAFGLEEKGVEPVKGKAHPVKVFALVRERRTVP